MRKIKVEDVIQMHKTSIEEFGGLHGIDEVLQFQAVIDIAEKHLERAGV